MNIHISKGNSKMNAVPSFSLPSGKTCSKEACNTCYINGCYARKIERLRPNVSNSYADNYEMARKHPECLEKYLDDYFSSPNAPMLFRLHVSGDFFSIAYFEMWIRIVKAHPHTKFLAFTKRHYIIRPYLGKLPQNLSLVYSAWPNVRVPNYIVNSIPVAWMQDGCEDRVPEDATVCLGNCEVCAKCWAMDGMNVVFTKHQFERWLPQWVKGNAWNTIIGFWSQTAYGDGEYEVYAYKDAKKIIALEIRF